jgi:site-specific recombinase XerD
LLIRLPPLDAPLRSSQNRAQRERKGASLRILRHSHASLLLEKGVDIATLSERLGHSSVATTAAI